MINAFMKNIGIDPAAISAGPDAATRRTAERGSRQPVRDFSEFLRREPLPARDARGTDRANTAGRYDPLERSSLIRDRAATESRYGTENTSRADDRAVESPRTREAGTRPADAKDDRTADAEPRGNGTAAADAKDASTASKRRTDRAGKAVKALAAEAAAKPGTQPADGVRKGLVREILAFLDRHKGRTTAVPGTPVNGQSLKDLERSLLELSDKDLKELKRFLDASGTFPGHLQVFKQFAAMVRDRIRDNKAQANAGDGKNQDQAFRIEAGEHGRKVYVNKAKIQVVDLRVDAKARAQQAEPGIQAQNRPGQPDTAVRKESAQTVKFDQWLMKEGQSPREVQASVRQSGPQDLKMVNQAFNDLVKWSRLMLEDKKSVMQIDLKPEHLGRVVLKLELIDNRLSAQIFAQNQGTGEMFKQNMGDLQNAFKQAGIDVERLDVNVASNAGGDAGNGERAFHERFRDERTAAPAGIAPRGPEPAYADLLNFGLEAERRTVNYIV
jgi:flagellar hook-length control protein FliK